MTGSADSLSAAAGKGIEVELRGQKVVITPLTLGDLAMFESHIRSQRLAEFKTVSAELDPKDRAALLRELLCSSVSSEEVAGAMASLSGARYFIYLILRRQNKDFKEDDVDTLVGMDNLDDVVRIIEAISGMAKDDKADPTEAAPSG